MKFHTIEDRQHLEGRERNLALEKDEVLTLKSTFTSETLTRLSLVNERQPETRLLGVVWIGYNSC